MLLVDFACFSLKTLYCLFLLRYLKNDLLNVYSVNYFLKTVCYTSNKNVYNLYYICYRNILSHKYHNNSRPNFCNSTVI